MLTAFAQALHASNEKLRAGLLRLQPAYRLAILPGDLADLRNQLIKVRAQLRSVTPGTVLDAEQQNELTQYRNQVMQLRQLLPSVYGRLLAEKVRVETARERVAATRAWTEASRKTL
jgi:hypothetical protein